MLLDVDICVPFCLESTPDKAEGSADFVEVRSLSKSLSMFVFPSTPS